MTEPSIDERDLGIAILLLLAKGGPVITIVRPDMADDGDKFHVEVECDDGALVEGRGDTLTEAAEACVKALPEELRNGVVDG